MSVKPAEKITVTIRGTSSALTFTPESIETQDGTPITELSPYVQSAIEDLLIFLWSGPTSSKDTWEIQITMKQNGEHGKAASSRSKREKRLLNIIEQSLKESNG